MRIKDFLATLEEGEKLEQTPAQQSVDPNVVQSIAVNQLPTDDESNPGSAPIEEPKVNLAKGAEDEEDEEGKENEPTDDTEPNEPAGDLGQGNPMDQETPDEDEEMSGKVDIKESFSEAFEKSLNEGTVFKLEIGDQLNSLFESQGFEGEFATQVREVFESAVNVATKEHIANVNKYAGSVMESLMAEKMEELESTVEIRLNEAVAEWTEANRIAIEESHRTQRAESFMQKLGSLMAEHFVDIPEIQPAVAVQESVQPAVDETAINAIKEEAEQLQEEVSGLRKELAIERFCAGMTVIQSQKVRNIAEGLVYTDADSFTQKLGVIKESFVTKPSMTAPKDVITEDLSPVAETKQVQVPTGDPLVNLIARNIR